MHTACGWLFERCEERVKGHTFVSICISSYFIVIFHSCEDISVMRLKSRALDHKWFTWFSCAFDQNLVSEYDYTWIWIWLYASVTEMLQSRGWRSLEQRRSGSRLCLFYKIIYGLVAIDMPLFVVHPSRILRNSHFLGFRQIQTTVDYYKYSFYPLAIMQWNRLPSPIALLSTFDSFKRAVCTVSHPMP